MSDEIIKFTEDLDLIITIGDYEIYAKLSPYDGEYTARVYYQIFTKKLEIGEISPALAIKRCKQWIAENTIENEVQA
jgi:hypothetical protein